VDNLKESLAELMEKLSTGVLVNVMPLPCPFCGSNPQMLSADCLEDKKYEYGRIECDNKKCAIKPAVESRNKKGNQAYAYNAAIRRWNTRNP
jgi:hypothetical protein